MTAPVVIFQSAKAFESWLHKHVDSSEGVWLKLAKKSSGIRSLTDDEAVDIGLCFGWISGQRKALDDRYYLQKYVPRRARSRWSQVNVAKVQQLMAAGRMQPRGLAEVEAARADGRLAAAYVSQRLATVPADMHAALAKNARARKAFEKLGKTQQYHLILRLITARTRETQLRSVVTELASSLQSS